VDLSNRAAEYLQRTQAAAGPRRDREEVARFLGALDVATIPAFVACLQELSGLSFITADDAVYFFSMPQLWRSVKKCPAAVVVTDANGTWLNVCESHYPGDSMLHESGSLHFETNLKALWFSSLARLVEASAFVDMLVGARADYGFLAMVGCRSVDAVLASLGVGREDVVADTNVVVCRFHKGALLVLHADECEEKGRCSVKYYSTTPVEAGIAKACFGEALEWVRNR
jgi:hypothetical protein